MDYLRRAERGVGRRLCGQGRGRETPTEDLRQKEGRDGIRGDGDCRGPARHPYRRQRQHRVFHFTRLAPQEVRDRSPPAFVCVYTKYTMSTNVKLSPQLQLRRGGIMCAAFKWSMIEWRR